MAAHPLSEPPDQGGDSGPEEDAVDARDHKGVPHLPVDAPHASLSGSLSEHNQRIVAAKLDEIRRSLHHWIKALIRRPAVGSPSCFSSQTTVEKTQECCFDSVSSRRCSRCALQGIFNSATGREKAEAHGAKRFLLLNQDFSEISVFGPAETCHVLQPLGGKGSAGGIDVRMPLWWGRKVRA